MKKILAVIGLLMLFLLGGFYFVFSTGKTVRTTWTEEDLISGIEKSQVEINNIEEINLETLTRGNFSTQGTNNIDTGFTAEEISALVSAANDSDGPIKDVRVGFGDNGEAEASFRLSDSFVDFLREENVLTFDFGPKKVYAFSQNESGMDPLDRSVTDVVIDYITRVANNRPVYATGELTRASYNSVDVNIERLTVGRVPMSEEVVKRVEQETVRIINGIIAPENGFHIEELQVNEGELYYKGTLPAEVEGVRLPN